MMHIFTIYMLPLLWTETIASPTSPIFVCVFISYFVHLSNFYFPSVRTKSSLFITHITQDFEYPNILLSFILFLCFTFLLGLIFCSFSFLELETSSFPSLPALSTWYVIYKRSKIRNNWFLWNWNYLFICNTITNFFIFFFLFFLIEHNNYNIKLSTVTFVEYTLQL